MRKSKKQKWIYWYEKKSISSIWLGYYDYNKLITILFRKSSDKAKRLLFQWKD